MPLHQETRRESLRTLYPQITMKNRKQNPQLPLVKKQDILNSMTLVNRCHYENHEIPSIITKCVTEVERRIRAEGLYKKSGSKLLVEKTLNQLATEEDTNINLDDMAIHVVTGVIKRYLITLPNPVFCFDIYDETIGYIRTKNLFERLPISEIKIPEVKTGTGISSQTLTINEIRGILMKLPQKHLKLSGFLSEHLDKIASLQNKNRMTLHNLAIVFSPCLIYDINEENCISDMNERNYVVEFVLKSYVQLFS
ncbi:GTPase-activating protein RGA2 NDAI_0A04470 [Naumovozyma dairenensis CBS 421]|uniref:Rho-GAP domain-containing protein n=1 Tax=Naumovozyma dairenensis (strain ATCC 10597 / BCRC 20456 / CBS 421 / NBRC 0211 / NRRL Y-12639) TaxID=1071378 RepID=G0W465_NAUDC|nr:hypothetical protein NDAI_0A04470 [Naumovozyma dairenensis CBS 421]CCD22603.1 hypothetical protein NDAI_0A04470 [Naumovozyma dairenensis CBS 421]